MDLGWWARRQKEEGGAGPEPPGWQHREAISLLSFARRPQNILGPAAARRSKIPTVRFPASKTLHSSFHDPLHYTGVSVHSGRTENVKRVGGGYTMRNVEQGRYITWQRSTISFL